MSECTHRYTHRPWQDDERDEEGVQMLEDLLVARWMNKAHQEASERNTCMELSYNPKTHLYIVHN